MTKVDRDKVLMLILPSLVVILGYGFFFLRGKVEASNSLAEGLVKAEAEAPSPARLADARQQKAGLQKEIAGLQSDIATLHKKWQNEAGCCARASRRNERVAKLTGLLSRFQMNILEDAEADPAKDGKLSTSLDWMGQHLAQMSDNQKPQLRCIRFQGRYADVQRALTEMSQGEVLAIPLALSMKTIEDAQRREWTMLVWI